MVDSWGGDPLDRDAIPELDAALRPRQHLVGVAQSERIEGAPDLREEVEIVVAEEQFHRVALLHADAVLAGERAAHLDARREDLLARRDDARDLLLVAAVVADVGVEVAVAGV